MKMPLFVRYGVPYVSRIDPKTYTVETYELRGAELLLSGTYGPTSSLAAAPFEAVRLQVAELWT